jgi:hypothetical protein
MAKKTTKAVVATEGATVDGRTIERSWIEQMAASYSKATYTATVNMEHIRGYTPDSPFRNYGFVDALETKEGPDNKLQLVATISGTDDLVKMTAAWQKVFTSIEVSPNFAKTGKAYLTGLAVTDTPASLGTGMLEFTAKSPADSPLTARKQDPANHFSEAVETPLAWEDVKATVTVLDKVKAIFASKDKSDGERYTDLQGAIEEIATNGQTQSTENARQFERVDGEMRRLTDENTALRSRLDAFDKRFATEPAQTQQRQRADGGAQQLTDF